MASVAGRFKNKQHTTGSASQSDMADASAAFSNFLSVQKALRKGTREGAENHLGWAVEYSPPLSREAEDWLHAYKPKNWYTKCETQCETLNIDFEKVRQHLQWTTVIAEAIDHGDRAFCYGAVHKFSQHDLKHAELVLTPAQIVSEEIQASGGRRLHLHHLV